MTNLFYENSTQPQRKKYQRGRLPPLFDGTEWIREVQITLDIRNIFESIVCVAKIG